MQRCGDASAGRAADITVRDLMASLAAGEDPRRTMRRLDARIVDCQRAGLDLPASFIRLSRTLAAEYIARRQGRDGAN
jgi:hypothetical protein